MTDESSPGAARVADDDRRLLELVTAIADGRPIDWGAIESSSSEEQRRFIPYLRAVAALSNAYDSSDERLDDAGAGKSSDTVRTSPDAPALPRWGALEIRERLGRGQFGIVYRAWDPALERDVALKLLEREPQSDTRHSSRVIAEGRLMARVRHPNVVAIYGAQRIDGKTGIWMEFVRGRTLADDLVEHGLFDGAALTSVGIELARALTAVHAANLVHRDIKPQNVLRDETGRIVLGDFGVGLDLDDESGSVGKAGTPLYLAPEIYEGGPATAQSDVYALGVLLFHLATGAYPVSGATVTVIREAHSRRQRQCLTDVRIDLPPGLTSAVDRALDPDPQHRFATAADLEAALTLQPDTDMHVSRATESRTHTRAVVSLCVLAAVGVASMAAFFGPGRTTPSASPPEPRRQLPVNGPVETAPTTTAPASVVAASPLLPVTPVVEPAGPTRSRAGVSLTEIDPQFQRRIRIAAGTIDPDIVTCFDLDDQAIALCNLATSTIRRVRPPARGERLLEPRLSPDDRRIVYTSQQGGASAIRVIDVDGNNDREVIRAASGTVLLRAKWHRNRRAFLVERRDGLGVPFVVRYLMVPEDGGEPDVFWSFDTPDAQAIDVSPDGAFIVFDRLGAGGNRENAIVDTATKTVTPLLADGNNDVRPRWTPDGTAVIFQSDRRARRGLYLVRVANGVAVSEPTLVLDVTRGLTTQVTFAGESLILQRIPHWYNGFHARVDLATGHANSIRPIDVRRATEETPGVAPSADGESLAYVTGNMGDATSAPARVVMLDRDGHPLRELPLIGMLSRRSRVRWSPDGARLAVLSQNGGKAVVEVLDAISGARLRVFEVDGASDIRFDPLGDGILYPVGQDLRRYDLTTNTISVHYRSPVPIRNTSTFDIARDGSLLLPTLSGIQIVRPGGRVIERFRFIGGECTALAWTADGSRIVVSGITNDPTHAAVVVMDAEAGDALPIRVDVEPIFDLALSADERELFMSAGNQAPQYWILRHFLP